MFCAAISIAIFPSIDHEVLKAEFRRRIACERTLALMDRIVDGSNAQEPVDLHFPGDDVVHAVRAASAGCPSATSPASSSPTFISTASTIASRRSCARPMCAMWTISRCSMTIPPCLASGGRPRALSGRAAAEAASAQDYGPASRGARGLPRLHAACGRAAPPAGGQCAAFPQPAARASGSLAGRTGIPSEIVSRVGAWIAHAAHGNTWRLRRAMFRGGWFDPAIAA